MSSFIRPADDCVAYVESFERVESFDRFDPEDPLCDVEAIERAMLSDAPRAGSRREESLRALAAIRERLENLRKAAPERIAKKPARKTSRKTTGQALSERPPERASDAPRAHPRALDWREASRRFPVPDCVGQSGGANGAGSTSPAIRPEPSAVVSTDSEPLTVTEALERCRRALEGLLTDFWIAGEATDLHRSAAGHTYFRLKDATGVISCVYFAGSARNAPADFRQGDKIEIRGWADIFVKGGDLQIRVAEWRRAGLGALYEAFLKLKAQLEAEGLFDPAGKTPLPRFVRRVAVVTSARGAALQDVVRTLRRRTPWIRIDLADCLVQGNESAESIVRALRLADRSGADAILLVRGGGSLEDLQSFNDERVARALASLRTPVVTGVGHETDVTIVDFVADVRASTPTAAAESISADLAHWRMRVEGAGEALARGLDRHIEQAAVRIDRAERHFPEPARFFERATERLAAVVRARRSVTDARFAGLAARLDGAAGRLASPEAFLSAQIRGLERAELLLGARIDAVLGACDARLEREKHARDEAARLQVDRNARRLAAAERWMPNARRITEDRAARLAILERTLAALDPDRPLRAGYVRLEDATGTPVLGSHLAAGERVRLIFEGGSAGARIEDVAKTEPGS
ncbi:exodeoxyribonuclease VII large subunit [Sutterella megalosphaeroides]|uniref:Exodeoxyribonuclease 7 large subunit n=1 Tax=Sutterella megalosphaeroides TaxID=2494234 RepID=A0A2Z6IAQ4_9BURK|nr:exodeoxyribonuclease VII large subunit [Sutterella megalosphaeroides]BBF22677.1 hypothetical protein SUTMEG_05680 [Sutterella megalosphaeroides]